MNTETKSEEEIMDLVEEAKVILEDFKTYMNVKVYAKSSILEHFSKARKGLLFLVKAKGFSPKQFLSKHNHGDLLLRTSHVDEMAKDQGTIVAERNVLRSFRIFLKFLRYTANREFDISSPRFCALDNNVTRVLSYMDDLEDIARKKTNIQAKERHVQKNNSFEFRPEDCHTLLKKFLSSDFYKSQRKMYLEREEMMGYEVQYRNFVIYSLILEVGGHRVCALLNMTVEEFTQKTIQEGGKWRIVVQEHKTQDTSGGAHLFVKSSQMKPFLVKWADIRGESTNSSDKFFMNNKGEAMTVIRPAMEKLRADLIAAGFTDEKDPKFLTIGGPSIRKMNVFIGYSDKKNRSNVAQLMCHSESIQRNHYFFDEDGKNKSKGHDVLHAALHSPSEASSSSSPSETSSKRRSDSSSSSSKRIKDSSSSSSSSSTSSSKSSDPPRRGPYFKKKKLCTK